MYESGACDAATGFAEGSTMSIAGFRNESQLWFDRVSQVYAATRESNGESVEIVVFTGPLFVLE